MGEVAALTGARLERPAPTGERLTGITLRAQDVRPHDLFAALPGSRAHGAGYAGQALERGAAAVLTDRAGAELLAGTDLGSVALLVVERPREHLGAIARQLYGDPSRRLAVVGVTGTSGKTTTCYLLEAALAADGSRSAVIGTVQTRIDGQITPSALTTPEAPDLQALLAVMVERGVGAVAMEVSSHALSLGRVSGTRFAVGAFTNLSQDHLDFHHDMEDYFRAKAMLFDGRAGAHVIDVDTEYGARLAAEHPEALTVSDRPGAADWSVEMVTLAANGVQHVVLSGPGKRQVTLDLAIPGAFNVGNAAVALACVDALGRDVQQAADALATVVVPGRMERVDAGQDFLAVVDYAHKPGAVAAVLDAIGQGLAGPLIVVLGAGGDRDTGKRPMMGAESAARADVLIVTDDNPRSERPADIRAQVLAGAAPVADRRPCQVLEIGDRRAAIRRAVQLAGTGGAVVIAGKGHEQGQEIDGVVHPFSDRDELRAALVALVEPAGRAGVGPGGPGGHDLSAGPTSLHRVTDAPADRNPSSR
ncbi:UDP-N-acetylmuramyl-tripeptide synthetase [Nakamurella multipartita DSM 44233]|uniref:UDP-N-acetylmuramoyl-L-alanyl-D-glutamate--2,6-diaminopimelate ligase n=1 Tax=Nakamurella multipartita (strain ATCC 700099 / DSM 44233 / CIP 104796 / JCM 9543 / NBRC 105858 / Y-104) TaxID=479431 RepID=C8XGZ1_NAKMY|nr:UDP-N-acetylmuramyl-tripeptide synthetase [Nakamurella multipartita DSM 44233]